jgi:hypothetical protein
MRWHALPELDCPLYSALHAALPCSILDRRYGHMLNFGPIDTLVLLLKYRSVSIRVLVPDLMMGRRETWQADPGRDQRLQTLNYRQS